MCRDLATDFIILNGLRIVSRSLSDECVYEQKVGQTEPQEASPNSRWPKRRSSCDSLHLESASRRPMVVDEGLW